MGYFLNAFRNYTNHHGRASRKEFWMFVLFHNLASFLLSFLDGLMGLSVTEETGLLTLLYLIAVVCPAVCLCIRRLHDINKSGYISLLGTLPLVSFYVLYLYAKAGDPGGNSYGPPPVRKGAEVSMTYGFCGKCGFALAPESAYCSRCGEKVDREEILV